jgi:hypothetical protein
MRCNDGRICNPEFAIGVVMQGASEACDIEAYATLTVSRHVRSNDDCFCIVDDALSAQELRVSTTRRA